jgi:hypothetical protein
MFDWYDDDASDLFLYYISFALHDSMLILKLVNLCVNSLYNTDIYLYINKKFLLLNTANKLIVHNLCI